MNLQPGICDLNHNNLNNFRSFRPTSLCSAFLTTCCRGQLQLESKDDSKFDLPRDNTSTIKTPGAFSKANAHLLCLVGSLSFDSFVALTSLSVLIFQALSYVVNIFIIAERDSRSRCLA